jgi:hypothetical protein
MHSIRAGEDARPVERILAATRAEQLGVGATPLPGTRYVFWWAAMGLTE